VDSVIGSIILVPLAATERLKSNSGIELGTIARRLVKSFGEGSAYDGRNDQGEYPA